jgi:hypothetical protein
MDYYFTTITLLGLRDQNLPPFRFLKLLNNNLEKQDTKDTNQ